MVKRTNLAHSDCPIARSLDAIGDWWSLLIIRDAIQGYRRFGEFQKSLGLAKNILTVRLRALVERGILELAPASDGSAYQEYVLTPKGRGIFPIIVALRQWSEEFDETFTIDPCPRATISGSTCLHTSMVPVRSTARARFHTPRSMSTTVVARA